MCRNSNPAQQKLQNVFHTGHTDCGFYLKSNCAKCLFGPAKKKKLVLKCLFGPAKRKKIGATCKFCKNQTNQVGLLIFYFFIYGLWKKIVHLLSFEYQNKIYNSLQCKLKGLVQKPQRGTHYIGLAYFQLELRTII